jgi:RNA polymerase sigma factor (sigma-70 family)
VIPTDSELIARSLVADDRAAFGELVIRYQSSVRNFLRHLMRGDAALADDLAQDTFVQAYRSLARFRGDTAFSTWVLGIAHNHWRNARRRTRELAPLAEDDPGAPTTAAAVPLSDLRHDLAEAMGQLSSDEQLALHLGFQQGLSHHEIAQLLDWPLGTVKTHLNRGKEKLRPLLAAWNPQA